VPLTSEQQVELESVKEQRFETKRVSVPELEEVLYEPLSVLDNGFIRGVDYMGDDAAIVQAARVSCGAGTKRARDDSGLINYLMRHWHTSPFEMCEIKLHVKLPIFVARQWIRHRTANVNEYSARYSILDREFYVPDAAHLAGQSAANGRVTHRARTITTRKCSTRTPRARFSTRAKPVSRASWRA
jgi:thymidylate synthase (FAD)